MADHEPDKGDHALQAHMREFDNLDLLLVAWVHLFAMHAQ